MDSINRLTYESIADEFAETRHTVWKCVRDFTKFLKSNVPDRTTPLSIVEIGCGNGKNMTHCKRNLTCDIVGIDTCSKFVELCRTKSLRAIIAESIELPFIGNTFDAALCIAMFHHLLTDEERNRTMFEILRVLKPGGYGILTCWATEQPKSSTFCFTEGINEVPWNGKHIRYYYVYSEAMFRSYFESLSGIRIKSIYNECGNWIVRFQKKYI